MCDWHYKYSVICLIRHTKEIREMCRIEQDVGILRFYFNLQKYFGTINFRRMSQDVGKLRGRIAQVPLYRSWQEIFNTTVVCLYLFWPLDIYFFKEGVGISLSNLTMPHFCARHIKDLKCRLLLLFSFGALDLPKQWSEWVIVV